MTYQLADGHDNAAGLAAVTPQPACEGIFYPKEIIAASGIVYNSGMPYCVWKYGPELPEDDYNSLLNQFGLASAKTNEVTVKTISDAARSAYSNYNATIVKPQPRYQMGFYKDVAFVIKLLEAL